MNVKYVVTGFKKVVRRDVYFFRMNDVLSQDIIAIDNFS